MTLAYNPDPHSHLVGVHPDLQRIFLAACGLYKGRMLVVEGVRSHARQTQLYAQGRTVPGKIVTWVRTSNHEAKLIDGLLDPVGCAIDAVALKDDGSIEWNDSHVYDAFDDAMHAAARELGIPTAPGHGRSWLRYGGDWDNDGHRHEHGESDLDHWELHEG